MDIRVYTLNTLSYLRWTIGHVVKFGNTFFFTDNHHRVLANYQSQQMHSMSRFDVKKTSENDDYEVTSGIN